MSPDSATLPPVRSVPFTSPLTWLARGWRDLWKAGGARLLQGAAVAVFGLLLWVLGRDKFGLLVGALSGFLVMAPVLATGFYVLSRSLERGGGARMAEVLRTWLFWQSHYRSRWDHDYWCLVRLGLLLALAGTGWVLTSAAMITLLAPAPVRTPYDFLLLVVLAKDNNLFELWLVLGSVLAAPIFASSVVSIALLLDRRIGLWRAVLTSWQAVLANHVTMALWSFLILALVLVGMATFMLGLALVMPWLGHASWHAYRDLVDSSGLPERQPRTEEPGMGHEQDKAIGS